MSGAIDGSQEMRLEKRPQLPLTVESLWDVQETLSSGIHAALQEVKREGKGITADVFLQFLV